MRSGESEGIPGGWIGQTLEGRYEIRALIGAGGMGEVYLAHDRRMDRAVVLKVPHERFLADRAFRDRFAGEIRNLTQLAHPHIVTVLDAGEHHAIPYAVLAHLAGGSLRDRLSAAGGLQAPAEVLAWLLPVAMALDFMHGRGVVHRDVKPGNVLFDGAGHAFLADFGIAKTLSTLDTGITQTGVTPGSPDYMAPESLLTAELSPEYDQYALATIAYEALCGALPYRGENALILLNRKQSAPPRHLTEVAPNIPPSVATAVHRALSRDPRDRYGSCKEFAGAFESACNSLAHDNGAYSGGPSVSTTPLLRRTQRVGDLPSGDSRPSGGGRTRRRTLRALVPLALAAATLAGLLAWQGSTTDPRRSGEPPGAKHAERRQMPTARRPLRVLTPMSGTTVQAAQFDVRGDVDLAPGESIHVGPAEASYDMTQGTFQSTVHAESAGQMTFEVQRRRADEILEVVQVTVVIEVPSPRIELDAAGDLLAVSGRATVAGRIQALPGTLLSVQGRPVPIRGDRFEAEVVLDAPGRHEVVVSAKSPLHPAVERVAYVRVPAAPVLAIESPADGARIEGDSFWVRGHVKADAPARVWLNSKELDIREGRFELELPVDAEGPVALVVESEVLGVRSRRVVAVHVTLPQAPEVLLESPTPGLVTRADRVEVKGRLSGDRPARVRIAGTWVVVDGRDFRQSVALDQEGVNRIEVTVQPARGKERTLSLDVVRDTTAPSIQWTWPLEESTSVSDTTAELRGRVSDAGTMSALLDGRPLSLDAEGSFHAKVRLQPGQSSGFEVVARDEAGNTARSRRSIRSTAARTWRVPGDAPNIQAAIDAAGSGDTVQVEDGTWDEMLTLRSGIDVIGAGPERCTLRPPPEAPAGILAFDCERGSVSGFSIQLSRGVESTYKFGTGAGLREADGLLRPVIDRIAPGTPAQRAGLRVGDTILAIDGTRITAGPEELRYRTYAKLKARTCRLSVARSTGVIDIDVATARLIQSTKADGIAIVNSTISVSNVSVSRSPGMGIAVIGPHAQPSILDCVIADCEWNGIDFGLGAAGWVERCTIRGNSDGFSACGLHTRPTISECKIHENRMRGAVW